MKSIKLKTGELAVIDDKDFKLVSKYKWWRKIHRNTVYAKTKICVKGKKIELVMHRLIMDCQKGDGILIDHTDRNGLNNRRYNLRRCSNSQNIMNSRKRKDGKSSQWKGVHWHKSHKKFMASIKINGKRIHLGYFASEIKAATAYNKAAKQHFKEFARVNAI